MISLIGAAVVTAVIAVFWGMTLSFKTTKSDAPTPFNAVVSSIKGTVGSMGTSTSGRSDTQIINVDTPVQAQSSSDTTTNQNP